MSCRCPEVRPADQILRVAGPGDRQHVGQAEGHVPAAHDAAAARGRDRRSDHLLRPRTSPAPPGGGAVARGCAAEVRVLSALGMEDLRKGDAALKGMGCFVHACVSARE